MAPRDLSFPLLLIFILSLLTSSLPSHSLSFNSYQTLFSLSHSLMARVANLRDSRGDVAGSNRARSISRNLERGLGGLSFWGLMGSVAWDYARNYAWRDFSSADLLGAVSDMNELIRALNESTRLESEVERVAWVKRNYGKVLAVARSLSGRLLSVLRHSGPLREAVETVQREVIEGDLLRDCLELGSDDLKGLIQVLKDVALQFSSAAYRTEL